jgi:hypothetical protein
MDRIGHNVLAEAQERGQQVLPRKGLAIRPSKTDNSLTPAITSSYLSLAPACSNFGLRRGTGGANDGRTRRSWEEVEYSVNTGIV